MFPVKHKKILKKIQKNFCEKVLKKYQNQIFGQRFHVKQKNNLKILSKNVSRETMNLTKSYFEK